MKKPFNHLAASPSVNLTDTEGMTIATNGGFDGSRLVLEFIAQAKRCLKPDGQLLLLLPHWSNAQKAYEALGKNYSTVKKIAEKKVEFFPVLEGKPDRELLDHIETLAAKGIIELTSENGTYYSHVSVIQAIK